MPEATINLQDDFLRRAKNEKIGVTVFLANKVQLHGNIIGFDKYAVILDSGGKQQLIFKHAITTILPVTPIKLSVKTSQEGNKSETK